MTAATTGDLPLLGLMLGDYTGIGAEQCARVLADRRLADAARLLVIGDARVLEQGARDAGVNLAWRRYATVENVDWSRTEIPIIDLGSRDASAARRSLTWSSLPSRDDSMASRSRLSTKPRSTPEAGASTTSTRCSPISPGTRDISAR